MTRGLLRQSALFQYEEELRLRRYFSFVVRCQGVVSRERKELVIKTV